MHQVGGLPAYVVAPAAMEVRDALVDAVGRAMEPDTWSIVIGRRGPMTTPGTCGGLLAPMVACDQLYTFTVDELVGQLSDRLAPALAARKLTAAPSHSNQSCCACTPGGVSTRRTACTGGAAKRRRR